jgi:hypothetical protein
MSTSPRFWATPIRYLRWASRERPAYFWSVAIGACGPLTLAIVPPVRRWLGDEDAPPIPLTYPGMSCSLLFYSSYAPGKKLLWLTRGGIQFPPDRERNLRGTAMRRNHKTE